MEDPEFFARQAVATGWLLASFVSGASLDHASYEIARIYEECSEQRLAVEAYNKDALEETPWECEECHTPHHESCYAESVGCATYLAEPALPGPAHWPGWRR